MSRPPPAFDARVKDAIGRPRPSLTTNTYDVVYSLWAQDRGGGVGPMAKRIPEHPGTNCLFGASENPKAYEGYEPWLVVEAPFPDLRYAFGHSTGAESAGPGGAGSRRIDALAETCGSELTADPTESGPLKECRARPALPQGAQSNAPRSLHRAAGPWPRLATMRRPGPFGCARP
jgi:hypothetical protein